MLTTDTNERYILVELFRRWWVKDALTGLMSSPRATRAEAQARLDNLIRFGSVTGKVNADASARHVAA